MKKQLVFCIFFMLFLFTNVNSYAFFHHVYYGQEESISYLDTVFVYDYTITFKNADSQKADKYSEEQQDSIGISVTFSNCLKYEYVRSKPDLAKEMKEKASQHICNVFKGDVVVVKVLEKGKSRKIVEFIRNLSAR